MSKPQFLKLDEKDRLLLRVLGSQLEGLSNPYYNPRTLENIIKDLQDIRKRNNK